ncbi:LuxR family two component transcriptional regulator [Tepidimonas ignava]|uniref:LuxR family two component transcriptional regulator n=1 Tax=Tepidimonas ignava TaxID=114249 RepID=A0A4R3LII3_9BURK|nr:response regulator transcription factor [Tepidimonas ignava]TCS98284.1 LuxR family two component transcriptional regulator [Tepidimonas ignava]TSE21793.1 Transcriptional regulatory protein DegU [Tepidimonas ignava]
MTNTQAVHVRTGIRVWTLCDQPLLVMGLRACFAQPSADLTYVGNGSDATALAQQVPLLPMDVALVDLEMADAMTAVRTLVLVRPDVPVLVLSASPDVSKLDAAVLAGARGVVDKHDPVDVLFKAIVKLHAGEFWLGRAAMVRVLTSAARTHGTVSPHQRQLARLTRKERIVIGELVRDPAASIRHVAARLCISERTLRNHLTSIYAKLELPNRTALHDFAVRHGWASGVT